MESAAIRNRTGRKVAVAAPRIRDAQLLWRDTVRGGKTVFLFVQYRDSFRSGCWTGIRINCGSIKQEKAHSPRAREVNHRDKSALTFPEKTLIANNVRSSCTPCTEENNPKFIIDREYRSSSHNPISKRI